MQGQSSLNDIRDNKVGDADSNLLNQQFMEQALVVAARVVEPEDLNGLAMFEFSNYTWNTRI